jgi:hypothetical protein
VFSSPLIAAYRPDVVPLEDGVCHACHAAPRASGGSAPIDTGGATQSNYRGIAIGSAVALAVAFGGSCHGPSCLVSVDGKRLRGYLEMRLIRGVAARKLGLDGDI